MRNSVMRTMVVTKQEITEDFHKANRKIKEFANKRNTTAEVADYVYAHEVKSGDYYLYKMYGYYDSSAWTGRTE